MLCFSSYLYADSVVLYDPEEIVLDERQATNLGFKPYIRPSAAFDDEVSMIVNFPGEIDGEDFKIAVARLFQNELSITTNKVAHGENGQGQRQVWINLNRAVVSKVKVFFTYGYKKYVITYEL